MYVYNEADQLTSETTGGTTTAYLYDANGALTKSDDGTTVNAYTYDYDGYQTAFDTTGTANDATYTYDADRRRVAKSVDSVTTKYFLDSSDVIADYDGSDTLLAAYITPGLDANVSQTRSGSVYYYMKDGLGSVRNLMDSSEGTQNVYDYYGFGEALGTWTENVANRYTFTAREWDNESGQYYYRARYCSGNGRFNQRDPSGNGTNVYLYVDNRPTIYVDSTGLCANCAFSARISMVRPPQDDQHVKDCKNSAKPCSVCDRNTGRVIMHIPNGSPIACNNRACIAVHEMIHVSQIAACCQAYAKAYNNPRATPAAKKAADDKYWGWVAFNKPAFECEAYQASYDCWEGYYKARDCEAKLIERGSSFCCEVWARHMSTSDEWIGYWCDTADRMNGGKITPCPQF